MQLRIDNPFSTGVIKSYQDSPPTLKRKAQVYTPNSRDVLHKLVNGDRLDLLAYTFYKNSKYWWVIADANAIKNPLDLQTGLYIRIPDLSTFQALYL
jgi:nucleoid-associated protein YgaU